jgi:hypothetical protein
MMGATGPTYENYWYDDISVASLNGDYNGDGSTDAADYVLWRSLNGNNLDGYAAWRTNFNPGAGAGNNGSLRSGSSIPEPSQKILAAVGGCLLLMIRSPRRRVSEEVCVRVCVRRIAAYRKSKNRCVLGRLVVACH